MLLFPYVSAFCTTAAYVTVTKIEGGSHGYAKVAETHDYANNFHDLACTGAGWDQCVWVTSPPSTLSLPNNVLDDMIDYAHQQMDNGVYSGTHWANFWYDNHYYSRSVSWDGMEPQNSVIQVNMQLIPD